jgi:hypothetical protein
MSRDELVMKHLTLGWAINKRNISHGGCVENSKYMNSYSNTHSRDLSQKWIEQCVRYRLTSTVSVHESLCGQGYTGYGNECKNPYMCGYCTRLKMSFIYKNE